MTIPPASDLFDHYAESYDTVLQNALSLTGEDKDFYIRRRLTCLRMLLSRMGHAPTRIMDFGCGTGNAAGHLRETFHPDLVLGVDVSKQSIETANQRFGSDSARFREVSDYTPDGSLDLAYCNGVFHHIEPDRRNASVRYISDSLRPGGIFAFWEHNPWNPGTRFVMDHCEFDQDAITLSPPTARRLLREAGLELIRTDFLFIFPRFLKHLRWVEPIVSRLPLGGQYQVLCRKRVR